MSEEQNSQQVEILAKAQAMVTEVLDGAGLKLSREKRDQVTR